jgi:hypothetical protein
MSVGASLLGLLGNKDPREALLQAVAGTGTATQPQGGAPYAAPAGTDPGTTGATSQQGSGVQASQPADALMSPPDLAKLYQDVLTYDRKASNMDRGLALIGSSISQDGNRQNTMDAILGQSGAGFGNQGFSGMVDVVQGINKQNLARQQRAAMLARLPSIARQYGLDLDTAQYLYDSGKLDSVISELEKPNAKLEKDGRGNLILVDQTNGQQMGSFGQPAVTTRVTEGPDGTKIMVDDAAANPTAANLGQVSGPNTITDDTKEYDKYVLDEQQRQTPADKIKSFEQWRLTKPPSSSSTTNINMPKLENKFDEKRGTNQADRLEKYDAAADNAMDMLTSFDAVEAGLNTGVRTGTFGSTENAMRRFGTSVLGMSDEDMKVAGGELVEKIGNRMALLMRNPESGMGMPGSVSDKDIDFLKKSQIGLDTSEAGNKTALEVFRRLERRKIEYAELANEYADDHGNLVGFRTHAREWFDKKPLFEDLKQSLGGGKSAEDLKREADLLKKYGGK